MNAQLFFTPPTGFSEYAVIALLVGGLCGLIQPMAKAAFAALILFVLLQITRGGAELGTLGEICVAFFLGICLGLALRLGLLLLRPVARLLGGAAGLFPSEAVPIFVLTVWLLFSWRAERDFAKAHPYGAPHPRTPTLGAVLQSGYALAVRYF